MKGSPLRVLGIETSCDETAIGVVEDGRRVVSNVVASSVEFHRAYGGVIPEIASRLHVETIWQVLGRALEEAHVTLEGLDAIAVTQGPGLPGALVIGLTMSRPALYRRIDARVESQVARGLVQETRRLLEQGFSRELGSMKGLGYRQVAGFVSGEYDYEEAVRRLKRDTRRFAKRQFTWFRKEPGLTWLPIEETESPRQAAERILQEVDRFLPQMVSSETGAAQCSVRASG